MENNIKMHNFKGIKHISNMAFKIKVFNSIKKIQVGIKNNSNKNPTLMAWLKIGTPISDASRLA